MLEQGKGKAVSLPLTSDLVQLLQAYLAKFGKKKHSGETAGLSASTASIKACVP